MAPVFAILLLSASHGVGMRTKIERFENWVDCEALTSYEQCDDLTQTNCPTECNELAKAVSDQDPGASQQENLGAREPLGLGEALDEALGVAQAVSRAKKDKKDAKKKKEKKLRKETFDKDERKELEPKHVSAEVSLKRQRMRRINDLEERLAAVPSATTSPAEDDFDYGTSGTIVQLRSTGFGFIKPDTSNDNNHNLYFHMSGLADGTFKSLRPGHRMKYEVGVDERRNTAFAKQVSFDYGTSGIIVQLKSSFGFIKPDTSDDDNHNLYFHASGVVGGTLFDFYSFRTRDRVKYEVGVDERRNKSIAIQVKFEAIPKNRPLQRGSRAGRGRGRDASRGRSGGRGPMMVGAPMMRKSPRKSFSPRHMQTIDEKLYRAIAEIKPALAGKVVAGGVPVFAKLTRMMLELDNSEPLMLLESAEQLRHRVDEALSVLGAK